MKMIHKPTIIFHRIHVLYIQTSDRNRLRIFQSHSKQRATGNIGKLLLFHQELHKSKKVVVCLNLINEHKGVILLHHQSTAFYQNLKRDIPQSVFLSFCITCYCLFVSAKIVHFLIRGAFSYPQIRNYAHDMIRLQYDD